MAVDRLGIVDAAQVWAARVAAANPSHAARILGRRTASRPATLTAPIILGVGAPTGGRPPIPPKGGPSPNPNGRPPLHPWVKLAIGEHFDVLVKKPTDRRRLGKQAQQAGKRHKRRYDVARVRNDSGQDVIRITRIS